MRFGEYEVVRPLGKGGMSEVYEVENVRLGSRHALKLFTYEKEDAEVRERFLAEGKILARLRHPRIVKVVDFGTDGASGRPYFVMDLVCDEHGQVRSLAEVQPGMADEEMVGRWYDDLREGLNYIHANGVIHRDLKLQNVLIGPDGHAVLADFGISKVFDAHGDGTTLVEAVNTVCKLRDGHSLVMGSVGYMAPELELGVAASRESDLYALGVIVYRLLTGSWCDARTDVVSALDTYSPVWGRILPKLLHTNPQGRECPSYAEELRTETELREFELDGKLQAAECRVGRVRKLAGGLAAALAVMVAAVAGLAVGRGGKARPHYDFDEFFAIPANATNEEQRVEAEAAQIDLLVLTHETFVKLNAGNLTLEGAIEDLEKVRAKLDGTFDDWPLDNMYGRLASDEEVDKWLLGIGIEAMKQRRGK